MFGKIACALLFAHFTYGITINSTIVAECAVNFSSCDNITHNCSDILNQCINNSKIISNKPQACYQAEAAAYAFKIASLFAVGTFSLILFLSNSPLVIKYLINRFECCSGCLDKIEVVSKEPINNPTPPPEHFVMLLKTLTTNTATTLTTVLTGTITFVSTGWLFNLWQSWTSKDADCQYYSSMQ